MLAWLSDWLKAVIAVVLLAGLVDLLLPGKAMQRYARLVVGLLVLTTLLSPILKLLGSDPEALLDAGFRRWSRMEGTRLPHMPGLDDIERQADRLRAQQTRQTGELASAGLSAAMAEAVREATGLQPERVELSFGSAGSAAAASAGGSAAASAAYPAIRSVTVRLAAATSGADGSGGSGRTGAEDEAGAGQSGDRAPGQSARPVEPVAPVSVSVEAGGSPDGFAAGSPSGGFADGLPPDDFAARLAGGTAPQQAGYAGDSGTDAQSATGSLAGGEDGGEDGGWAAADPRKAAAVRGALYAGWAIPAGRVSVLMRAGEKPDGDGREN